MNGASGSQITRSAKRRHSASSVFNRIYFKIGLHSDILISMTKTNTQTVSACYLRKGDVAHLPYFGQLVKSRITSVELFRASGLVSVRYIAMVPGADWENCCRTPADKTYAVSS